MEDLDIVVGEIIDLRDVWNEPTVEWVVPVELVLDCWLGFGED